MFAKPKKNICPMLKSECIESSCMWWTQISGKHPQTGQDLSMPDCAMKWLPILMIENSKVNRETGAAVEDFRNHVIAGNNAFQNAILDQRDQHLLRS